MLLCRNNSIKLKQGVIMAIPLAGGITSLSVCVCV
jgi:hypothetical protein